MAGHDVNTMTFLSDSLPHELLTEILRGLDYPSLVSLQSTCHSWADQSLGDLLVKARNSYSMALFQKELTCHLLRQQWHVRAREDLLLHCFTCFSLLPTEKFVKTQCKARKSLGHADAVHRICITCGLKSQRWAPGTTFKGGLVLCTSCRQIRPTDTQARREGRCYECWMATPSESEIKSDEIATSLTNLTLRIDSCSLVTRANRCTRCWSINHTVSKATTDTETGESLCLDCKS